MRTKPAAEPQRYTGPDGKAVQQMFAGIAHRYDFLNHFLSASVDRRWRRLAVAKVAEHLKGQKGVCADVCSGTGDLAIEVYRRLGLSVLATDFCHPMLVRSRNKIQRMGAGRGIRTIEADAMALPFADNTFDAITIAFGLRNLEDPRRGLAEFRRLLKPEGVLVILEFSRPVVPVMRELFQFYFHHILPRLGACISGQRGAYSYLPDSVSRFPHQQELLALMESAGFRNPGYRNLSWGIAALHWGLK